MALDFVDSQLPQPFSTQRSLKGEDSAPQLDQRTFALNSDEDMNIVWIDPIDWIVPTPTEIVFPEDS